MDGISEVNSRTDATLTWWTKVDSLPGILFDELRKLPHVRKRKDELFFCFDARGRRENYLDFITNDRLRLVSKTSLSKEADTFPCWVENVQTGEKIVQYYSTVDYRLESQLIQALFVIKHVLADDFEIELRSSYIPELKIWMPDKGFDLCLVASSIYRYRIQFARHQERIISVNRTPKKIRKFPY